ncbi:hypothetical protein FHE65_09220 [Mumia zhuanghuii]|uniref:DUF998 domain-containing protein n=1 Tax=Mumia zhuanghuii TaxID=2585211 RepID=A0A5C4MTJ4_9ACTN|nr:hypothetical protein FHE65_10145 [Mumia zhuanghuii]TNC47692.1 hypothetical protein FHE65_09220 [Mumia zhuanghuii]
MPRDWRRPAQVVGLVVLCAIGAELLAAYGESTGDPGAIAFSVVFFAALYGAPAVLTRDLVRRRGWGWPSMLLLFAALGVTEACLVDQSLFSSHYQGYDGWEESREATLIPALGISAFNAYNFVVGHVIFSFGAPVAVAEGWRAERAREPWLGIRGSLVAAVAYVGAATLILSDPESRSGSPVQLLSSVVVVAALALSAALVGTRGTATRAPRDTLRDVPVWAVFAVALIAALITGAVPETWNGFVVGTTVTGLLVVAFLAVTRRRPWPARHVAAVGLAFMVARGLLAFTYYPLIGEVATVPKYLHNTVMLLAVAAAGLVAMRLRDTRSPAS